jgi:hypothetical protein
MIVSFSIDRQTASCAPSNCAKWALKSPWDQVHFFDPAPDGSLMQPLRIPDDFRSPQPIIRSRFSSRARSIQSAISSAPVRRSSVSMAIR